MRWVELNNHERYNCPVCSVNVGIANFLQRSQIMMTASSLMDLLHINKSSYTEPLHCLPCLY